MSKKELPIQASRNAPALPKGKPVVMDGGHMASRKTPEPPALSSIGQAALDDFSRRSKTPEPPELTGRYSADFLRQSHILFQPLAAQLSKRSANGFLSLLFSQPNMCTLKRAILVKRLTSETSIASIESIQLRIDGDSEEALKEGVIHEHGICRFKINKTRSTVTIYLPVDEILEAQAGRHYPVSLEQFAMISEAWVIEGVDKSLNTGAGQTAHPVTLIQPELQVELHSNYIALDYQICPRKKLVNARLLYNSVTVGDRTVSANEEPFRLGMECDYPCLADGNIFCDKSRLEHLKALKHSSPLLASFFDDFKKLPQILYCQEESCEDELVEFSVVRSGDELICFGEQFIFYAENEDGGYDFKYTPPLTNDSIMLDPLELGKVTDALELTVKSGHQSIVLLKQFYLTPGEMARLEAENKYIEMRTVARQLATLLIHNVPLKYIDKELVIMLAETCHHNLSVKTTHDINEGFVPWLQSYLEPLIVKSIEHVFQHSTSVDVATSILRSLSESTENESLGEHLINCLKAATSLQPSF